MGRVRELLRIWDWGVGRLMLSGIKWCSEGVGDVEES